MKKIISLLALFLIVCAQDILARTYVLSTGVSNYEGEVNDLHQTTKDAKAFKELMSNKSRDISLLTSSYANHDNILKTLKTIAASTQEDDVLIFFYSGHGSSDGSLYTYSGPLRYDEIVTVLRSARARKKFCFIDACFSGACGNALMQNGQMAYDDICFLVSSRPNETSAEHPVVGAGFFTQALIQGMRGKADGNKDRKVTIAELFKYVSYDVTKRSQKTQHPQLFAKKNLQDFVIY